MAFISRCALAALLTAFALNTPSASAASRKAATPPPMDCVPISLRNVLADVERTFGPVRVTSTHRPHAVVKGSHRPSFHRDCRAVDFRVSGKRRAVIAFLRRDPRVQGLGVYGDGHIHIDNGPRRAAWND